jgi:hypothetical protein
MSKTYIVTLKADAKVFAALALAKDRRGVPWEWIGGKSMEEEGTLVEIKEQPDPRTLHSALSCPRCNAITTFTELVSFRQRQRPGLESESPVYERAESTLKCDKCGAALDPTRPSDHPTIADALYWPQQEAFVLFDTEGNNVGDPGKTRWAVRTETTTVTICDNEGTAHTIAITAATIGKAEKAWVEAI